MASFGDRLRSYMEHMHNLDQQKIADILGVSIKTISGYASKGKSGGQTPTYAVLLDMSDKLGVDLDWLTGRAFHPMWAPDIIETRLWLRGELGSLTPADHANLLTRMAAVLRVMSARVPRLKENWFTAGVIGIPEEHVPAFWNGTFPSASVSMVNRVAEFTGLTDKWLMSGRPEHLSPAIELGEWMGIVQRLVDHGLSAADVAQYLDMFVDTVKLNKVLQ